MRGEIVSIWTDVGDIRGGTDDDFDCIVCSWNEIGGDGPGVFSCIVDRVGNGAYYTDIVSRSLAED